MDSCSPSSASRALAEGTKSHRANYSAAKPFLLPHAAAAAASSSKPHKPSASVSKPSARLHPPASKIPSPLGRHSEKKADMEPAVNLQGLRSSKSGEKSAAKHEALRKEKAVVKDEAFKNEKALVADEDLQDEKVGIEDEVLKEEKADAEDESVGTEKAAAKDGAFGEEMTMYIDQSLRKAGNPSVASPLQEFKQNGITEKEKTEGHDCAENKHGLAEKEEKKVDSAETYVTQNSKESLVAADIQKDGAPFDQKEKDAVPFVLEKEDTDTENGWTNFLKVPAQQDPSSPVAETKKIVYSEQNHKFSECAGQAVPVCLMQMKGDLDVKQSGCSLIFTEHLDSEQEGFLFAKGEPIFKESTQSSENLPAVECSTLTKFKEQDIPSLSQFEAAVIAASDLKAAPSATLPDVACNGISSMASSENRGLMEAAMVVLAKDVLVKCPALENFQHTSLARQPALSCPWKLSRRAFVISSLVVLALLCVLCFASAVTSDERSYLHPT